MRSQNTTAAVKAGSQEENAVAFETLFDPLYAQKYRLVRVEIFPVEDADTKEPRGAAILKKGDRLYTSVLWVRHGQCIFGQPEYAGSVYR